MGSPKQFLRLFPMHDADKHWLYAIGTPDGMTKIGMTCTPHTRVSTHRRKFGGLSWCHLFASGPMGFAYGAEYDAVRDSELAHGRIGRTECFQGVSKEVVLAVVRKHVASWQKKFPPEPARSKSHQPGA